MKLVHCIDLHVSFPQAQRDAYDKFNGFVRVADCRLAAEF